ncbi:MAG: 50S ribosomal protein L11 methyltransferase [Prevotella sp.]|jgi:ribosomal protein L11 methyltransferase
MKYKSVHFIIEAPTSELLSTMRDLVAAAAGEAGFEAFQETNDGCQGYIQEKLFDKQLLDEKLDEINLSDCKVSYSVSSVEDKDWNANWEEQGFSPISIGDSMVIYDKVHTSEQELALMNAPIKIGIEARQAFGTGTHETTRMILATLTEQELQGKRVLDCGCGTGILGIAASKLGADEVVAYDIDEWSVKNTKHNAEINHVNNIEVYEGDCHILSHINGMFDVVLANINRNILLHDLESFCGVMSSESILVMSGFYEADIPSIMNKASSMGLREDGRKLDSNWCCLTLKKE